MISENDAAGYRSARKKIRRDNRIQPIHSQIGNMQPEERVQMNTISGSIADNNRFIYEKVRRHRRTPGIHSQMDTLRSREKEQGKMISENIEANNSSTRLRIIRKKATEQIAKQNDTQALTERKQLKTISESIEVENLERSTYEGPERNNIEEPTDIRNETSSSMTRVIRFNESLFSRIFTYGLIICLPLSNLLFSKAPKQKTRKICLYLWIIGGTATKTLFFAVLCVYNNLLWPSFALDCLYMAHCMIGCILMWIFLCRGRKIISSVRRVFKLMSFLDVAATEEVTDPLTIYFPVSIICVYVILAIQVHFHFISEWESVTKNLKSSIPFPEHSEYFHVSCSVVLISAFMSFNTSYLTLYVVLYLTGTAYRYSGHLFTVYGRKLKKDIERGYFTAQTAHESISQFQYVISCVTEIDNTFNIITFMLCAEVYVLCFGYPSLLLNPDQRFKTIEHDLFGSLVLKTGVDMLFYLCYSGDKFYKPLDQLKKDTIALSGYLMNRPSIDVSTLVMFNLLSRQIKEAKPCVTACEVYDVKSRLIPNIFGALISYGVLLDKFGANSSY